MIREDLRPIVLALLSKARQGEVNWAPAADIGVGGTDDDVVVVFPDYSLNVYRGTDEEGEAFTGLLIFNSRGKRVDGTLLYSHDEDFPLLEEIVSIATRQLSGVDKILESLERALLQPGVIGTKKPSRRMELDDDDLPF